MKMKRSCYRTPMRARLLAAACMIFLLTALLAGCQRTGEAETKSDLPAITVGCDTYAPFSYVDVDGNLTGIDIELATEAFHRMGYEP